MPIRERAGVGRAITAAALWCAAAASAQVALAQVQSPQERIDTALARAQEAGVPVALLESKIAEGKAKGVSLDRIAAAVARREAALERASQALESRERASAAELAVAADAVESGVSEAVLRTISETAPRDRRAVAIAALTQLVELGHVPETALAQVMDALKRGPEALLNLPARAGRRGGDPPQIPDAAGGRAAPRGGPPSIVPAPGGATQPTRPQGPPDDRGRPATPPAAGRGSSSE